MDVQLAELMRELEEKSRQLGGVPRVEREAGQFLNMLVKIARAVNILQVGVDDGYFTLWLADAATATDGMVTAVEPDVWKLSNAKKLFTRSPHVGRINLMQGDPVEVLPVLEGPYDFVLLGADHTQALHYFHILVEKLNSGALICCDKTMSLTAALTPYLTYVHERPGLESILVPVGEGLEVTYKIP